MRHVETHSGMAVDEVIAESWPNPVDGDLSSYTEAAKEERIAEGPDPGGIGRQER